MDADLKKRWVEALRSGEFKQGQHQLRNCNEEFCCMGVLAHLIDESAWEEGVAPEEAVLSKMIEGYAWEADLGQLRSGVLLRIGLDLDLANSLMRDNDLGVPFTTLARRIEKEA